MPLVGLEPLILKVKRLQTHASHRTATGIGIFNMIMHNNIIITFYVMLNYTIPSHPDERLQLNTVMKVHDMICENCPPVIWARYRRKESDPQLPYFVTSMCGR